ncbi:MAG: hypothetical protein LBD41_02855, partial [Clostridiales Family XIII bacterium]|nr:hypothetical protein [Clostridiales Family XIII bacterium]
DYLIIFPLIKLFKKVILFFQFFNTIFKNFIDFLLFLNINALVKFYFLIIKIMKNTELKGDELRSFLLECALRNVEKT